MEIVKITKTKVSKLYSETLRKNEKAMASLLFEAEDTPLKGTIYALNEKAKNYNDNLYFTYKVQNDSGEHIGEISVNRFFDTEVKENNVIIIASEGNKGKVMLKPFRLTNTSRFGTSRAEQIANLIGVSYTAKRVAVSQPIDYKTKLISTETYKSINEIPEAVKKQLWDNTQINEKAMKIAFD